MGALVMDRCGPIIPGWAGRWLRTLVVVSFGLLAVGCASPKTYLVTDMELPNRPGGHRVLLMPADVVLSELAVGGTSEPNAAWTKAAKGHIERALADLLKKEGARLIHYRAPKKGQGTLHKKHIQLVKLHDAVVSMIGRHGYAGPGDFSLPTKKGKFDWTLGKGVAALRKAYKADYALFVYMRDSYSTDGRKAMMVVTSLFGGARGGVQKGYATLVDLRSGQVIWINYFRKDSGDLRTAETAREASQILIAELPL